MSDDLGDFMRRFTRDARERLAGIPEDAIVLTQYTIYERPRDYPDGYVVRAFHIVRGHTEPVPDPGAWHVPTLERARSVIPDGLFRIDRLPGDDPNILEVWT
jgi:hypothetical protein